MVIHSPLRFPPKVRDGSARSKLQSTSFLSIDAVGPVFLESIIRVDHTGGTYQKWLGDWSVNLKLNLPLDFIVDCEVVFPQRLGMTEWALTFASFAFFTVATVGPTKFCASHKLTKGGICRKVLNNSSGNPINFPS